MPDTRVVTVLISATVLVVVLAAERPPGSDQGLPEPIFWQLKVNAPAEYDVVFCGDSRTYRGISPAAVNEVLPDRAVLNFGFASVGLTGDYLEHCADKLSPTAEDPILVVGVTPYALTENAWRSNAFIDAQALIGEPYPPWRISLEEWLWHLRPVTETEIQSWDPSRPRYRQYFHEGGWVESTRDPVDQTEALRPYLQNFLNNSIADTTVAVVLGHLRDLTGSGVRVFGFRPPVSDSLFAIEEGMSGFDEASFVRGFEEAGGRWISIRREEYPTYDGSHLAPHAAEALSRRLARAVRDGP